MDFFSLRESNPRPTYLTFEERKTTIHSASLAGLNQKNYEIASTYIIYRGSAFVFLPWRAAREGTCPSEYRDGVDRRYGLGRFFLLRESRCTDAKRGSSGERRDPVFAVLRQFAYLLPVAMCIDNGTVSAEVEYNVLPQQPRGQCTARNGELARSKGADVGTHPAR